MHDELTRFVDSLAIPDDRKAIVRAELADHVACAREAAVRAGDDPDAAARAALGDLGALRRSLEAVEAGFRITRWHALGRGFVAALVVAIVIDQGGALIRGTLGALAAIAIAAVFAPPRALLLLRGELRARHILGTSGIIRGVPIGPVLTYLVTVVSVPFVVWIALIVGRALGGDTTFDTPWAAFALPVVAYGLLLVEAVRARHAKAS